MGGCSDYELNGKPPGDDPIEDTADTAPDTAEDSVPVPGECGAVEAPPIAVSLNDACDIPVATGTFTPVVEWELRGNNGYGPPAIAQLTEDNGDGRVDALDTPDIVFVANNGSGVHCVDGATGREHWVSRAVTDGLSMVAIGDLEGDGKNEVVASNGTSQIVAMRNDGTEMWRAAVNSRVGSASLNSSLTPAIADMDGDGYAEIIAGHTIIAHDGTILGEGNLGVGSCPNGSSPTYLEGSVAVPVDVDGDGLLEVVVGNAVYNMDGSTMYTNGMPDGTVAVADFDHDGEPEYAVNSRNMVYTLETDLTPTGWSDSFAGTNYVGPIAVDDLNGDGNPDFVAVGSSEMRAYNWDGSRLWVASVRDSSGAAGPILYDFENDGYPEVVYADETNVRVFNGLDGSIKLDSTDHDSATLFETPVVADVDGDGEIEIIMQHGGGANGLTVFGDADHSWPAGRQVWNQHAYSITNVNDDGTIPSTYVPNWTDFNNFRSGDAGLPPSSWNDLAPEIVDVCVEECPDRLVVTVRVWNEGTEEVDAGVGVVIRAGANGPVVSTATVSAAIPSGMSSAGVELVIAMADLGGAAPWVEVDRDVSLNDAVSECMEDNNASTLGGVTCE